MGKVAASNLELGLAVALSRVRSTKLALDKSEAQSLFFSVRLHRAACLAASVGLGAKPHNMGGHYDTPPY